MIKSLLVAVACATIGSSSNAQMAQLPIVGTWRSVSPAGVLEMTIRQNGDTVKVDHSVVDSTGKSVPTASVLYIKGIEWVAPDNSMRTIMTSAINGGLIELTMTAAPRPDNPAVRSERIVFAGTRLTRTLREIRDGRIEGGRSEAWARVPKP